MFNLNHIFIFTLVVLVAPIALSTETEDKRLHHREWTSLLQQHVTLINSGSASQVDYAGMAEDRVQLKKYLKTLEKISKKTYSSWTKPDQLAFLINSYNAWTVELILTAYPELESIKDLGSFFQSPWKKVFIPLLGKQRSLDDIEHGMIRKPGRFDEPRIHFAVNCASIGCPALINEAFTGEKLEQQLEVATKNFLKDRSRNYLDAKILNVSSIFKWYRGDFEKGWRGHHDLSDFLVAYSQSLGLDTVQEQQLKAGEIAIQYLDYDWRLNKKI